MSRTNFLQLDASENRIRNVAGATLPSAGQVLTATGPTEATWQDPSGGGGGVTWSVKTANYTASTGNNLLTDTSGGAFTITLPATPATAAFVTIKSGASASTNNLTVGRNGQTIMGLAENMTVSTSNIEFTLVFDGTTWRL